MVCINYSIGTCHFQGKDQQLSSEHSLGNSIDTLLSKVHTLVSSLPPVTYIKINHSIGGDNISIMSS